MTWLHPLRIQPALWVLSIALALTSHSAFALPQDWDLFKSAFISEGRVVDQGQNGMSHTEGQGMAMLLAVQNNDPKTFQQLWNWTQRNLQVREDKLFAWSWSPGTGVNDRNNASDGDLFIAWALSKAYTRWNEPSYLYEAIRVSQSIRQKLLRKTAKGIVILPGEMGFEKSDGLKLNLSYWVFPAIQELAILDPAPEWADLKVTGLQLIAEAQYGQWHLPPNWLLLKDNVLTLTDDDRFGYDAVRIPLYLIWGQEATAENMKPFQVFWKQFQDGALMPSWVDLQNGGMGTYNASMGFHDIANLSISFPKLGSAPLSEYDPSQGYYSSMLSLFTQSALESLKK